MLLDGISDVVRAAAGVVLRSASVAVLTVSMLAPAFAAGPVSEHLTDIDVRDIESVVKNAWPGTIVSMNGFRDLCKLRRERVVQRGD
jgi:hypothetical protein